MNRKYAENGWALCVPVHDLRDNGVRGFDGYTLIVELDGEQVEFHLDDKIVEKSRVKAIRRGSLVMLRGMLTKKGSNKRYEIYKVSPAEGEADAGVNRGRLSGTLVRVGSPRRTMRGRTRRSVTLTSAGMRHELKAYEEAADQAATLNEGDEVALDMRFAAVPKDRSDPSSAYKARLEIHWIGAASERSSLQTAGAGAASGR